MKRLILVGLAAFAVLAAAAPTVTTAAESGGSVVTTGGRGKVHHRKRHGTKVYGYASRRGGYSYSYGDSINTYGDARGRFGSTLSFRDRQLERQTPGGPFDHGFFYSSPVAPHGGESPYMH